jgi:peptide deformylase
MINPVITRKSEKMFISEEGCLSLPNILGNVKRHQKVTVSYRDENGEEQEQRLR